MGVYKMDILNNKIIMLEKQIKREKRKVKEVLLRDLGLCACCGFEANEVHHITPLIYGGKDNINNMVSLCSYCHKHSPDTLEEFNNYKERGGARYEHLLGAFINNCIIKGFEFHKVYPKFKLIFSKLRELDQINCLDKYNIKKSLELGGIDNE